MEARAARGFHHHSRPQGRSAVIFIFGQQGRIGPHHLQLAAIRPIGQGPSGRRHRAATEERKGHLRGSRRRRPLNLPDPDLPPRAAHHHELHRRLIHHQLPAFADLHPCAAIVRHLFFQIHIAASQAAARRSICHRQGGERHTTTNRSPATRHRLHQPPPRALRCCSTT
ncbi:hypothetical protein Dimus_039748 [Dionaea muscipula]